MAMTLGSGNRPEETHSAATVTLQTVTAMVLHVLFWWVLFACFSVPFPLIGWVLGLGLPLIAALLCHFEQVTRRLPLISMIASAAMAVVLAIAETDRFFNTADHLPIETYFAVAWNGKTAYSDVYLLMLFLLTAVFVAMELRVRRRGTPLLSLMAPVAAALLYQKPLLGKNGNYTPVVWILTAFLLVLIYAVLASSARDKFVLHRKKINASVAMLMAATVFALIFLPATHHIGNFTPFSRATQLRQSAQKERGAKEGEGNGLPHGDLTLSAKIDPEKDLILTVNAERALDGPYYFRAYCGENFHDGKWSVTGGGKGLRSLDKKHLSYFFTGELSRASGKTAVPVTVTYGSAPTQYCYLPYETAPEKAPRMNVRDTIPLNGNGSSRYSFSLYPAVTFAGQASRMSASEVPELAKAEEAYREYARENYLSVDSSLEQDLDLAGWTRYGLQETDAVTYDRASEVLKDVNRYFRNYDLTRRNNDEKDRKKEPYKIGLTDTEKKEPLQAFRKSRRGYDIHFATLGTLLFREAGIPARYMEGYLLRKDDLVKGETSLYEIRQENSHAWVEIYLDGQGWTPVEVKNDSNGTGEQTEPAPRPESPKPLDQGGSRQQPAPENPVPEAGGKKSHRALLLLLLIPLLAAAGIGLYVLIRRIQERKTLARIRSARGPESVFAGYRMLLKTLKKKGYPADPSHPEGIADVLGPEFLSYYALVEKERWSQEGLTHEERKAAADYCLRVMETLPKAPRDADASLHRK